MREVCGKQQINAIAILCTIIDAPHLVDIADDHTDFFGQTAEFFVVLGVHEAAIAPSAFSQPAEVGDLVVLAPDESSSVTPSPIKELLVLDGLQDQVHVEVRRNLRLEDWDLQLIEPSLFDAIAAANISRSHGNDSVFRLREITELIEKVPVSFVEDEQVVLRHLLDLRIEAYGGVDLAGEKYSSQLRVQFLVSVPQEF